MLRLVEHEIQTIKTFLYSTTSCQKLHKVPLSSQEVIQLCKWDFILKSWISLQFFCLCAFSYLLIQTDWTCVDSCSLYKWYKNNLPLERHLGPRAISHQRGSRQANSVLFLWYKDKRRQNSRQKFSPEDAEDFLKMELRGRRRREQVKQMPTIPTGWSRIVISSVNTFRWPRITSIPLVSVSEILFSSLSVIIKTSKSICTCFFRFMWSRGNFSSYAADIFWKD